MAVLAGPFDMTGSNGSSLPAALPSSATATGSSATIQGNRARLNPGTSGGYAGKQSVRWSGGTPAAVEAYTLLNFAVAGDQAFELWVRGGSTTDDGANGYFVSCSRGGTIDMYKAVSFSYTNLGSTSFSFTTGTNYGVKMYAVGTSIKCKVWTGSEPGAYSITATDSSITSGGTVHFHCGGGGSASQYLDLDDITITDGSNAVSDPPLIANVQRPLRVWRNNG